MKIGIRIALIVVVCVLGYLTVKSIVDPINFQKKVEAEEELIKERLTKIKDAQLAYKEVHGSFTDNWDALIKTAKTGSFMVLSIIINSITYKLVIGYNYYFIISGECSGSS